MFFKKKKRMDEGAFWKLIEEAGEGSHGDVNVQIETLTRRLVKLSVDEIIGFQRMLDERLSESYTSDLWAAAYIVNGGCGDDEFDYFRGWLIAQGRDVFGNAMKNPETLVSAISKEEAQEIDGEGFLYIALEAYENKTGKSDFYDVIGPSKQQQDIELTWEEDEDQLRQMFPILFGKFGT